MTRYERVPVTIVDGDWRGWEARGLRYWHFRCYYLPTCALQDGAVEHASDERDGATGHDRKRQRKASDPAHPPEGGVPWSELVRAADLEQTWMRGGIARGLAAHARDSESEAAEPGRGGECTQIGVS